MMNCENAPPRPRAHASGEQIAGNVGERRAAMRRLEEPVFARGTGTRQIGGMHFEQIGVQKIEVAVTDLAILEAVSVERHGRFDGNQHREIRIDRNAGAKIERRRIDYFRCEIQAVRREVDDGIESNRNGRAVLRRRDARQTNRRRGDIAARRNGNIGKNRHRRDQQCRENGFLHGITPIEPVHIIPLTPESSSILAGGMYAIFHERTSVKIS